MEHSFQRPCFPNLLSLADVYAKALRSPGLWLYLSCPFFSPCWINKTFSVTAHISGNVPAQWSGQRADNIMMHSDRQAS